MLLVLLLLTLIVSLSTSTVPATQQEAPTNVTTPIVVDCAKLHPYQFQCYYIDYNRETEQPMFCNADNSVPIQCVVSLSNVVCADFTTEFTYNLPDGCRHGAHVQHSTAMLLSLFAGLLGLDRFYLGYYTIGLIKLFSMGGLFIIYFIDIVLIALQVLEPADGTGYVMHLFGPRAFPVRFNNQTMMVEDYSCHDCR
ncbi:hypothetical protein PFISCL1PPCAC_11242 [Pristionchus fissidentatus]|uniref:TM2 domain-containing protein n=1 Tax=Pristionchus fissidentatus TaxID=1538716 RepID=A0AAV5VMN9_9BILA|nr:hypothetical protein PFISCL1PPCAC_11242 [Pristionchus fissidentatus]